MHSASRPAQPICTSETVCAGQVRPVAARSNCCVACPEHPSGLSETNRYRGPSDLGGDPMSEQDKLQRTVLPDSGSAARGSDDLRRQGPRHQISADPSNCARPQGAPNVLIVLIDDVGFGASSAFGGPCHTPNFEKLAAQRPQVQPLPHHGALLADPPGDADRPQPSFGGHGRHHRNCDLGARLQLDPAEHHARRSRGRSSSTATRPRSSASATKCRSGRRARWARSTPGRPAAAGLNISTASSAARPTSIIRRSTRARRRSSRRRRPRRAITSPRT